MAKDNFKHKWFRGSGKTTRMIEAAKMLGKPVAVVARNARIAEQFASDIGNGSKGFSVEAVAKAYETGMPVFVDSEVFDSYGAQIMPPPAQEWKRLPAW
jgi:hypothetical protein